MNIKDKYIEFFESKNHTFLEPASLLPNDNTTLFTSAGIQQLVPYMISGEEHTTGNRLVNYQKCLRLTDIEAIGDSYHHTFFEMLGNWSMNNYFKNETIEMSYEFLVKKLNMDPNKLAVTVFKGDENISKDEEAIEKWKSLGIPEERIACLGYEDNWWPSVHDDGPCGTDTEIFYWRSDNPVPEIFDPNDDRWVEIWNNVFVQFNRIGGNNLVKLDKKYIDTGMGVERMTSILEGLNDNYKSELFKPIINVIEKHSNQKYNETTNQKYMRIIADHIRAIVMICSDDKTIIPSNKDRGYILKRLMRRMMISAYKLEINDFEKLSSELITTVIEQLKDYYPYITTEQKRIETLINSENKKFSKIITTGEKRINKALEVLKENDLNKMDSKIIFRLYETYGVPLDLTYTILNENNVSYDTKEVDCLLKLHKIESKKSAEQKFKNKEEKQQKVRELTRTL